MTFTYYIAAYYVEICKSFGYKAAQIDALVKDAARKLSSKMGSIKKPLNFDPKNLPKVPIFTTQEMLKLALKNKESEIILTQQPKPLPKHNEPFDEFRQISQESIQPFTNSQESNNSTSSFKFSQESIKAQSRSESLFSDFI